MVIGFLEKLFTPGPAKVAGGRLYEQMVAQARRPAFYQRLGATDTVEGRFEVYTLHLALLLTRLKGEGGGPGAVSQVVFDHYVSGLDHGLRELGVGDLTVGKNMRKLGSVFYGRLVAYESALKALPQTAELDGLLMRTVYAKSEGADPAPLRDYAADAHTRLAASPTAEFLEGRAAWPAI